MRQPLAGSGLRQRFGLQRGFTLIDTLAAAGVCLIGGSVCVAVPSKTASQSAFARDLQNLHAIGLAGAGYAMDNEDWVFSLDWRPGDVVDSPDLEIVNHVRNAFTDTEAASAQQADIVRRMTGRPGAAIPIAMGHAPHVFYGHLVLADRLGPALPNERFVSPADSARQEWILQHDTFLDDPPASAPQFVLDGGNQYQWRWPYSSSYEMTIAAWSPDTSFDTGVAGNTAERAHQSSHTSFFLPRTPHKLGRRSHPEVSYPSQKAWIYDPIARHFGTARYHGYRSARTVQLFFDGSVSAEPTGMARLGWFPNQPSRGAPCGGAQVFPISIYRPDNYEPPTLSGETGERVLMTIEQTRGGLKGIDFGARSGLEPGCADGAGAL